MRTVTSVLSMLALGILLCFEAAHPKAADWMLKAASMAQASAKTASTTSLQGKISRRIERVATANGVVLRLIWEEEKPIYIRQFVIE